MKVILEPMHILIDRHSEGGGGEYMVAHKRKIMSVKQQHYKLNHQYIVNMKKKRHTFENIVCFVFMH